MYMYTYISLDIHSAFYSAGCKETADYAETCELGYISLHIMDLTQSDGD